MVGSTEKERPPAALSDGAAVALGAVFSRLVKPAPEDRRGRKRPRGDAAERAPAATPVVLAKDEATHEALQKEQEERRRYRENKRAKVAFERNARVVPDAATNAPLEKELRAVATQGAVALFNAIAKAQRAAAEALEEEDAARRKKKSKENAVSKDKFMGLIKAGVIKTVAAKKEEAAKEARRKEREEEEDSSEGEEAAEEDDDDDGNDDGDDRQSGESDADDDSITDREVDEGSEEDSDDGDAYAGDDDESEVEESDDDEPKKKAEWLEDDFMTKGSRKLKDFDRKGETVSDDDDSDEAGSGRGDDDGDESSSSE